MAATKPEGGGPTGASPVAFWLLPAAPWSTRLQADLDALAARFDAPRFAAHVTLRVGRVADLAALPAALRRLSTGLKACTALAGPCEAGDVLFRSLAIRLQDDALQPMSAALADLCLPGEPFTLDAHLSLLYQLLDEAGRLELTTAHTARWQDQPIRFDRIAAIAPGPDGNFANVALWREAAVARLADG